MKDRYFVGRYGGDEFIIIAEGVSGIKEIETLVDKIADIVLKFNGANGEFQLSYACGYAYSGEHPSSSISDLLNVADQKMYENKAMVKRKAKK